MKNVNVLLAVVLCAGLCVLFGLFNRSADESLGWSPNDMYMQSISSGEGASFTSANLSGGNVSNDGVAVSMRNGSFSLRTRARHASSPSSLVASGVPGKSADFWGALSPNSLIGHMTSSAEFQSFGGGSNASMGSYTSSSNRLIASSPAIGSYSQLPIAYNPITSSPNNLIAYSPSNGEVQVSAEQALMSASSSASGLFGSAMQNTYGTASYGEYLGISGSKPSGVRGRQNAGEDMSSTYEDWLRWFDMIGWCYGTNDGNGNFTFDNAQSEAAYAAWASTRSPELPIPSYAEWLKWLMSQTSHSGKDGNTYSFVPVGNILPLLLMALMYMIILFVKRNKTAQL